MTQSEEELREKADQYPNMGCFIREKLIKQQELYEKKYSLQYPCIYDIEDVTEENLGNFEFAKHKEEHREPEERC